MTNHFVPASVAKRSDQFPVTKYDVKFSLPQDPRNPTHRHTIDVYDSPEHTGSGRAVIMSALVTVIALHPLKTETVDLGTVHIGDTFTIEGVGTFEVVRPDRWGIGLQLDPVLDPTIDAVPAMVQVPADATLYETGTPIMPFGARVGDLVNAKTGGLHIVADVDGAGRLTPVEAVAYNPAARFVSVEGWSSAVTHSSARPDVWVVSGREVSVEGTDRQVVFGARHELDGAEFSDRLEAKRAQFDGGLIAQWRHVPAAADRSWWITSDGTVHTFDRP